MKSMEETYRSISAGQSLPPVMLNKFGAWVLQQDGSYQVFGFDEKGNHYELPEEEQKRRIDGMGKWLKEIEDAKRK